MSDYLERLREQGWDLQPPASGDELNALEQALGRPLPEQMRALYEDHGGGVAPEHLWIRLMTPAEAAAATAEHLSDDFLFDEQGHGPRPLFRREEFALFWTDDNANYAGVFVEGPLTDMVFVFDHEDWLPVPAWASVRSFYSALLDCEEGDFESLARDFPRGTEAGGDQWDTLAGDFFAIQRAEPESSAGLSAAHVALALSSPDHAGEARALLTSTDMWVQAAAVEALSRWGLVPVEDLVGIVASGTHNGRLAAKRVLAQIADDRGLQAVADDEVAYWGAIEERDHTSALHRVEGLDPDAETIRAFRAAIWWTGRRLALRQYDATELHGVPSGMAAGEIAAALDRPDLPAAYLPDGGFEGLGVDLEASTPLTLTVAVPFWWRPGTLVLVADLRLVENDGRFDVAVESIREPISTSLNWTSRHEPGSP